MFIEKKFEFEKNTPAGQNVQRSSRWAVLPEVWQSLLLYSAILYQPTAHAFGFIIICKFVL